MSTADELPTSERRVCAECIGEDYLADLITRTGIASACHYCSRNGFTITIEELSKHVERAVEQHFERTSSEPEGYEYYLHRETGNWKLGTIWRASSAGHYRDTRSR